MNMQLRELIEALTRQLDQSMPTAQTNVSGFSRDSYNGEIRLHAELTTEREEELIQEIDNLKGDVRSAESRAEHAEDELREMKEKLRWSESEVNRLSLERTALMS